MKTINEDVRPPKPDTQDFAPVHLAEWLNQNKDVQQQSIKWIVIAARTLAGMSPDLNTWELKEEETTM